MGTVNLWESKLKENYIFFNNIEEYFNYLINNNKNVDFKLKNGFVLGNNTEDNLDAIALKSNISVNYTSYDYPIAISKLNFLDNYVNPAFFTTNKEKFIKYSTKLFDINLSTGKSNINFPDFILSNELLQKIINNKDINFLCSEITGNELTEDRISLIQKNNLNFSYKTKQEVKKISSKFKINNYTIEDLNNINNITLILPIDDTTIANFKYINQKAEIHFRINSKDKQDELNFFNNINSIISKLADHNQSYNIKFNVNNREFFRQSNLINSLPNNINLTIVNDNHEYNLESYKKEEIILEEMALPIRNSNLSPLEKYIAAYNIVKQFKKYKENYENKDESRYLRHFLNNEYIVCVGFSKLLKEILDRINIKNKELDVSIDASYDNGFSNEEIVVNYEEHARNLIKIDDDKYNVHGIYIADATWDNNLEHDFYQNCLMTFDRKKEALNLEKLTDEDLLLDFHNFDDFNQKINYYLQKQINKNNKNIYKYIYNQILNILLNLDYEKYEQYFNKYNEKINNPNTSFNELEKVITEMLSDYGKYIIPLSNNNVDMNTILNAASFGKQKINGLTDEQTKNWLETTINVNEKLQEITFPYIYDYNNQTEGYLDTRKNTK